MAVASEESGIEVLNVEVPSNVCDQVRDQARMMSAGFDATAATLLRLDLEAQRQRESRLADLVERLRSSAPGSEERRELGDLVGETIFGE